MKTISEMIAVMQAAERGEPIESTLPGTSVWCRDPHPVWSWGAINYRVAVTKPSIDWNAILPEIIAITANDQSNQYRGFLAMGYTAPPNYDAIQDQWLVPGGRTYNLGCVSSFKPGNAKGKDAISYRPGSEP